MNSPLPYGWISQIHPGTGYTFYVDTKADPPRSIWTHPYEDEQYLNAHPDVREKVRGGGGAGSFKPAAPANLAQRHSFSGHASTPMTTTPPPQKKGFFGKIKTKMENHNERKRQEMLAMQQANRNVYGPSGGYAAPGGVYPQQYMGTGMYPGMMGSGMGMMGSTHRRGMGGGGMALPLVGGLAGGLLLGDMLDGGGGWGDGGGDWGGGGGDFGGGGFDSGGGGF